MELANGDRQDVKSTILGNSNLASSRLVYGCMRISGDGTSEARENGKAAIRAAVDAGYTHFDHADLYGDGQSESLFGEVLSDSPGLRDNLLVTSKCGIRQSPEPGFTKRYDFSKDYILNSVDGSLERLGVEYLDLFMLHRPDFLMDPDEVAQVFDTLKENGKVRNFGVSNFLPTQFSLLQKSCDVPLLTNQIEINIDNMNAIVDGTLDQCMELNVSPMAWCPLGGVAYPAWGESLSKDQHSRIQSELAAQSEKYDAEPWVVILAWLLIHPSEILPIIGSTQPDRIRAALKSLQIEYQREDWYRLLEARNGEPVA